METHHIVLICSFCPFNLFLYGQMKTLAHCTITSIITTSLLLLGMRILRIYDILDKILSTGYVLPFSVYMLIHGLTFSDTDQVTTFFPNLILT